MASMQTSAPKPPVTDLMYSTGSVVEELHVWVAPNSLAHASLRSSMSTAMIVDAPASRAPAMAASPTPPQPNTATVSPRRDAAGVDGGADAGHHAAAEQPGGRGRRRGVDLRALPGGDERLLGERADAERRRQHGAVGQRHLLGGVVGGEAVPRLAPQAGPALAAHGPPVEDHEVAGRDVGDAGPDGLDDAGGLVAEQEREVVVDAALAVVQVGVADPAGLDLRRRASPGPGIGDDDRLDGDRLALGAGDDSSDFLRHAGNVVDTSVPERAAPATR